MRRVIVVFVTICILFMCCVTPVSATENDDLNFYNILDYQIVGNGNNLSIDDGENILDVDLGTKRGIYYIDMLIRSDATIDSVVCTISGSSTNLIIEALDHRNYRIYGKCPQKIQSKFTLSFNTTDGSYIFFNQLRIANVPVDTYDIEAYCDISTYNYSSTIHYVPTDDINHRSWTGTEEYTNGYMDLNLRSSEWTKFDYIDMQLMITCNQINSISCIMGSENVPFEVTNIYSPNMVSNDYFISIRIDLRGLRRDANDFPMVIIEGSVSTDNVNMVSFMNCSGLIVTYEVNTLFYYFSMVKVWIQEQTDALLDAIRGDTTSGDEFNAEVQEELNELDQMQAVMDSVTRPAIDSVNVGVDDYVSQADISVLATPMTVLLTGEIFGPLVIMTIIMATVSYVLYGKR